MTLFVCWALFPAVLALLSLGCGSLVARAARTPMPGALVLPVGFAAIVVTGLFATLHPSTARLATPTVVALAVMGLAASLPLRARRVDVWAVAASAGVFGAFAAPVVLSGEATFAGYIKLDDTSTFLAITDRALEHGRDLAALAPSSYEAALAVNLPFYPLGSLLPLGAGATLTGQDPAWVFQPYLAFLAALLALVLYELAAPLVASRALRAAAAVLAAQAALLYGYALWGGVKELAAAPLIALAAALAGVGSHAKRPLLPFVPLAFAAAALVGVLSLGAIVWLAPILAVAAIPILRGRARLRPALLLGVAGALVVPSLAVSRVILDEGVLSSIRDESELGNLLAPLSPLQLFGVWPTGDFRVRPDDMAVVYVLIAVVGLAAIGGLFAAAARRTWELPVYVASATGAAVVYASLASPWIAAKAFAVGAPALVLAAVVGCGALLAGGRRVEGAVALSAVTLGVLWSTVLAYREANLAPREQLVELEAIGERFAGQGPALMTEYQPYGVRHFLRELDAEGASELRRRPVALKDGSTLPKGGFADLAAFRTADLLVYRTLVLRRIPVGSRPPAGYRLVWQRRFYEVWQRAGDAISGAALPCRGRAIVRPVPLSGSIAVAVPRNGRYDVWVGGSFRGELTTLVDGRRLGSERHQLSQSGQFVPLGSVTLAAGEHTVELRHRTPLLQPGAGGAAWPMGPVALSPADRCGPAAAF